MRVYTVFPRYSHGVPKIKNICAYKFHLSVQIDSVLRWFYVSFDQIVIFSLSIPFFLFIMDSLKRQRYWLLFTFFIGYILIPSVDFVTDINTAYNYISYTDPLVTFYIPQDLSVINQRLGQLDDLPSLKIVYNFTELNYAIQKEIRKFTTRNFGNVWRENLLTFLNWPKTAKAISILSILIELLVYYF